MQPRFFNGNVLQPVCLRRVRNEKQGAVIAPCHVFILQCGHTRHSRRQNEKLIQLPYLFCERHLLNQRIDSLLNLLLGNGLLRLEGQCETSA